MLKVASQTDIGRVRTVNEDRAIVQEDLNGLTLAIVADGMGGHQAGDVASQMAVELIQSGIQQMNRGTPITLRQQELKAVIEAANEKIFELASQKDHYHGMGTTVVAVVSDEKTAVIAHIGDSRAYRIHAGEIEQLTEDHSLVNELVKSGQITRAEAEHHPRRNVLTRALGTEPTIEVDVREISWQAGDCILLCSDGLSGLLSKELILQLVTGEGDLQAKVARLVAEALSAGGDDNITVVLAANGADAPKHHDEKAR